MATVLFVHQRLAMSVLLYLAVCTGWGLVSVLRRRGVSGSYLGALVIGEGVLLVQGALGAFMATGGVALHTWLHAVYGGLAALSLPAAYGYTRGRQNRNAALIYALTSLWVFGLCVRAAMTGAG